MNTTIAPKTTILIAIEVATNDAHEAMRQAQCFINRATSFPVKESKLVTKARVIVPFEAQ